MIPINGNAVRLRKVKTGALYAAWWDADLKVFVTQACGLARYVNPAPKHHHSQPAGFELAGCR